MALKVQGEITSQQLQAVKRLQSGLAHHDYFGAKPDDTGVFICESDTLYELPYEGGQFCLGDLRDLLSIFTESN